MDKRTLGDGFRRRVANLESLILAKQLVLLDGSVLRDRIGGQLELGLLEHVPAALVPEFLDDVARDEVVGGRLAEGRDGRCDQGTGVDDEVLDGALARKRRLLLWRGHSILAEGGLRDAGVESRNKSSSVRGSSRRTRVRSASRSVDRAVPKCAAGSTLTVSLAVDRVQSTLSVRARPKPPGEIAAPPPGSQFARSRATQLGEPASALTGL